MHVHTVSREDWSTFLLGFAEQHRDWLADVRLVEPGHATARAEGVPLLSIEVPEGAPAVTVHAGPVTHTLVAPRRIRVFRREDGADASLEVDGVDGARLSLEFPVTQPAEAVDGYFEVL